MILAFVVAVTAACGLLAGSSPRSSRPAAQRLPRDDAGHRRRRAATAATMGGKHHSHVCTADEAFVRDGARRAATASSAAQALRARTAIAANLDARTDAGDQARVRLPEFETVGGARAGDRRGLILQASITLPAQAVEHPLLTGKMAIEPPRPTTRLAVCAAAKNGLPAARQRAPGSDRRLNVLAGPTRVRRRHWL